MDRYVKSELEKLKEFVDEKIKEVTLDQEKEIETNVKNLIRVKDNVEEVQSKHEQTVLRLDQLDESLKLLHSQGLVKDAFLKQLKKLSEGYTGLKTKTKETKKNIESHVQNESDKNKNLIKRHEDQIKKFT